MCFSLPDGLVFWWAFFNCCVHVLYARLLESYRVSMSMRKHPPGDSSIRLGYLDMQISLDPCSNEQLGRLLPAICHLPSQFVLRYPIFGGIMDLL